MIYVVPVIVQVVNVSQLPVARKGSWGYWCPNTMSEFLLHVNFFSALPQVLFRFAYFPFWGYLDWLLCAHECLFVFKDCILEESYQKRSNFTGTLLEKSHQFLCERFDLLILVSGLELECTSPGKALSLHLLTIQLIFTGKTIAQWSSGKVLVRCSRNCGKSGKLSDNMNWMIVVCMNIVSKYLIDDNMESSFSVKCPCF